MTLKTLDLARSLVTVLEDKKAENIVLLDLQGHCDFADYFVICSAGSTRQVDALADAIAHKVRKEHRLKAPKTEGHSESGWLLLDFNDMLVHIFAPEQRRRYNLEELWSEGKVILRIQ